MLRGAPCHRLRIRRAHRTACQNWCSTKACIFDTEHREGSLLRAIRPASLTPQAPLLYHCNVNVSCLCRKGLCEARHGRPFGLLGRALDVACPPKAVFVCVCSPPFHGKHSRIPRYLIQHLLDICRNVKRNFIHTDTPSGFSSPGPPVRQHYISTSRSWTSFHSRPSTPRPKHLDHGQGSTLVSRPTGSWTNPAGGLRSWMGVDGGNENDWG